MLESELILFSDTALSDLFCKSPPPPEKKIPGWKKVSRFFHLMEKLSKFRIGAKNFLDGEKKLIRKSLFVV